MPSQKQCSTYFFSVQATPANSRQCRGGFYALPKTMFDLFLKTVGFVSAVVSFFREGMKPPPLGMRHPIPPDFPMQVIALDMCHPIPPAFSCKRLIVNGVILSQRKKR